MTTIHPTMLSFLEDQVSKGVMGKRKSIAFVCEVQPEELGLVLLDRSSGDIKIQLLDDDSDSETVIYKGKPQAVTPAPFTSPENQLSILLKRTPPTEEEVVPTAAKEPKARKPRTPDLAVSPKKAAPKPAAKKVASKKTAKVKKSPKKVARKILLPSERLIKGLLKELNLDETGIPSQADLFKIVNRRGNEKVALNRIAVFCDSVKIAESTGKGLGVRAIASMSMNTGADNIMNLLAEVNPERMKAVGREILRLGVLLEDITVVKSESILSTAPEEFRDRVEAESYQCISGRHRLAFLGLLYGTDVKIPVRVLEGDYVDYSFACRATVMSNDTRPLGKEEAVYYHGMLEELTAKDIDGAFKRTGGKLGAITKFASYYAVLRRDGSCGTSNMLVTDKPLKGTYSLTITNWKNCFHEIIGALIAEDPTITRDWENAQGAIRAAVQGVNNLFAAIPLVDPSNPTYSSVWTAYGSTVLGKLMGGALRAGLRSGVAIVPQEIAEKVARVVVKFAQDKGTTVFARETRSTLMPMIEEFADKQGLDLPRLRVAKISM